MANEVMKQKPDKLIPSFSIGAFPRELRTYGGRKYF
jgi:hypothetical protein